MANTVITEPQVSNRHFLNEALSHIAFFVLQRVGFGLLVLLIIIFLTHFGLDMARGSTAATAITLALPRTVTYLGQLLQGDLGMSTAITSDILPHAINEFLPGILQKSFGLLTISLLFATLIGVAMGTFAATRRNRSLLILLISIIGISAPSFFIALLLQMLVIRGTALAGYTLLPVGGFGWDKHLILPALVLSARPIAQITRITHLSIRETLAEDFVRTAHGKGLRRLQVMWGHVFRNAAVPILTTVGLSLRFSLSSLPVVELFFGWPGLGFLLLKAIARQDDNLTLALLLSLGIFFILANLFLEVMYRFIDPRLRQTPEHIMSGERPKLADMWRSWRQTIQEWRLPVAEWRTKIQDFFYAFLPKRRSTETADMPSQKRTWRRGFANNIPLLAGGLLVAGLAVVFLFGPEIAPHSPYTTQGLKIENGEFSVPPFAPGTEHPWGSDVLGRDMMSLILAGAQQTLLLAALVVIARVLLGFALGTIAGWWQNSWLDRTILALSELLSAFPTLLFAMIFILALGIREGLRPFLIALCVVGWSEIMQFVRSEVIAIRPRPFIESAIAVGSGTTRIITRHILPNLLSALISLSALEMGAVLMLLGELGFVGIFIGGGAFAELDIAGALYHYSDVPEWGSLLSNIRPYARPYPWTALYPTLAFFVAILGFNLFGEGIRRFVEKVGMQVTRLFNRYTFLAALLVIFGIGWIRENTGSITFYRQQAAVFDGEKSLAQVEALLSPEFDGRSLGSDGAGKAAEYIADQFEALGLQAGGQSLTYFQTRPRDYQRLTDMPQLTINDGGSPLVYEEDYREFAGAYNNLGRATAPVHFVASGELTSYDAGFGRQSLFILEELDLSEQFLMVLSPEEARKLDLLFRRGTLVIADDPVDLQRNFTLAGRITNFGDEMPEFWIDEETADRLLAGNGHTVAELRNRAQNLQRDEMIEFTTDVTASMNIQGTIEERFEMANVIGHLPGLSAQLDSQLIIVLAQYDTPPIGPNGEIYPAANDNASGVALMLETIRTMQESGYQPYKTFLFIAYSGEGQEGGHFVLPPDVTRFLQARSGFLNAFDIEAIIDLRGVGGGTGDQLNITAGGSLRLAELMERSADQMGVRVTRSGEPVDLSILFTTRSLRSGGQEAPEVGLQWSGWEATSHTAADTLSVVTADNLEEAGRVLSLALMIIGRETQY